MSLLFVSGSKQGTRFFNDPSARYRCIFPAESLNALNFCSSVIHIDEYARLTADVFSVIVFHRPTYTAQLATYVSRARQQGQRVIADFDDLLFAPEQSAESSAVKSGAISHTTAQQLSQQYLNALNLFDECIVSTQPLADWVRKVSTVAKVHVVPNQLPRRWFFQQSVVPVATRFEQKILRYLPGTSHHDADFALLKPALIAFLNRHADVTLEVIGPLRFELPDVNANQVRHVPPVPFDLLASHMADTWVCVAPLVPTAFNACKSGLKFWEAGLYGVPLVASPLADFADYANAGLQQVTTEAQWLDALEHLLDEDAYTAAAESAAYTARRVLHGETENPYLSILGLDLGGDRAGETVQPIEVGITEDARNTSEAAFYRIQQQFFAAWFGPGWMAYLLKPESALNESTMPGEVVDKAAQLAMLKAIRDQQHWACSLLGMYKAEKPLGLTLSQLPELPDAYQSHIAKQYSNWAEWVADVSAANTALWVQQRQPAGSPFMRKWRKFRRSPKHFFEDAKSPWLNRLARLF